MMFAFHAIRVPSCKFVGSHFVSRWRTVSWRVFWHDVVCDPNVEPTRVLCDVTRKRDAAKLVALLNGESA